MSLPLTVLRLEAFGYAKRVLRHILASPGYALGQSRLILHGWKEDSILVKRLAAYTHLSSTISEILQIAIIGRKLRHFHKAKAQVLCIAPLNMRSMCQRRFTIVEVATDQHWL